MRFTFLFVYGTLLFLATIPVTGQIDNMAGSGACGGERSVTYHEDQYALVEIGKQCWFKENLRSSRYQNGEEIPGGLSDYQWVNADGGAQSVYGEGSSQVLSGSNNEETNLKIYGRLYNWYAVRDSRNLCPQGYHVPSDSEWMTLEMALGMTAAQVNDEWTRGTDEGLKLKASSTDSNAWDGTNSSGFSGLPGGGRSYEGGYFRFQENNGYWWTSSPAEMGIWYRYLGIMEPVIHRRITDENFGASVRCLRDE